MTYDSITVINLQRILLMYDFTYSWHKSHDRTVLQTYNQPKTIRFSTFLQKSAVNKIIKRQKSSGDLTEEAFDKVT